MHRRIFLAGTMAQSRYAYVKNYEREMVLLPNCWAVVRLDGQSFSRFCQVHEFEKPNDVRGLDLMNAAAKAVMKAFPDVCIAYGESDEMSFVFRKDAEVYGGRSFKIVSLVTSCFTGNYVHLWPDHFPERPLKYAPLFDGRVVQYPTAREIRDYLSWRQVDTHINNQYNTCFWALVKSGMSEHTAHEQLKGTDASAKNELLFGRFGINYNNLPEMFRKGSVIYRQAIRSARTLLVDHVDIIKEDFWEAHRHVLE